MYQALLLARGKLGDVHVGENNRRNPGNGMMDWSQIARSLREIGYDKTVTMEPLVRTGGTVATDSKIWRDMNGKADDAKMDANARDRLSFMKRLLAK